MDKPFKTPEQIAADEKSTAVPTTSIEQKIAQPKKLSWFKQRLQWVQGLSKKQKIIGGIVLALVVIGGIFLTYKLTSHKKATVASVVKKAPAKKALPASTTVASKLTGLQVAPEVNSRPVTGIMIENSTFARPQSGLAQAGVVFEAVAEGGITRFLALYQDIQPTYVGPVRSVRPYYLQWDLGFDAPIAHVGGSPEALSDITSWGVQDLDQFYNSNAYQRITSRDAPHNVYTSVLALNTLEASKGFTAHNYTSLLRKPDKPQKTPTASSIDIAMSSSDYNPHYDYVAATNSYRRSVGGALATDQLPTTQLMPKNVVVMVMQMGIEPDDKHTSYAAIGSGPVYVFLDGGEVTGTWEKATQNSQIIFKDSAGTPMGLNAGQTWITIADSASEITFH